MALMAIATSLALPARAQLFRTYLASDGNDSSPCTLAQPCRLLPAALAAVANEGEVWMLDSANYNTATVEVTKSVTIQAVPGALGSVVTNGHFAINIDTPGVKVTLRNLHMKRLTDGSGIVFSQGAEFNMSDCETNMDIHLSAPGSKVTIRNTAVRNTGGSGIFIYGTVVASLDRMHITGNGGAGVIILDRGAHVAISNSVIAGNGSGISVQTAGPNQLTTQVSVSGSTVTANGYGLYLTAGGGPLEVTASRNLITQSSIAGIYGYRSFDPVTIISDANVVTGNAIGFWFDWFPMGGTPPVIYTLSNNTVNFNGIVTQGGSLTPLAPM